MGRALTVGALRIVLAVHALLVAVQPIAAGEMLEASEGARAVHQGVAGVLLLVAAAQIGVAILARWPGGLPVWPIPASVTLLVAETTQLVIGYAGELALHLPLGVAIVASVLVMLGWSLRRRPAAARRPTSTP